MPKWEAMGVSRPLPAGLTFPFDWGFVPSTCNVDGDPLDACVIWDVTSFPGIVVACRALGVLNVEQNKENFDRSQRIRNDRVVAVPIEGRRERTLQTFVDIPERVREEWVQFAIAAAVLDGKDPTPLGWGNAEDALALIRASNE
jgi:inorganic pyrophosphatase